MSVNLEDLDVTNNFVKKNCAMQIIKCTPPSCDH